MITLHELLASRDARHATQQKLLAEHSGKTLVCLTVVMPGSVKRNHQSLCAAHAAVEAIREAFHLNDMSDAEREAVLTERDLNTGYEAYLVTPLPLLEAKRIAVTIEDTHPLGRLFDIDVIKLRRHTCRKKRYRRKTTPLSRLRTRSTLLHEDALAHAGGDMGEDKRDGRPLH